MEASLFTCKGGSGKLVEKFTDEAESSKEGGTFRMVEIHIKEFGKVGHISATADSSKCGFSLL